MIFFSQEYVLKKSIATLIRALTEENPPIEDEETLLAKVRNSPPLYVETFFEAYKNHNNVHIYPNVTLKIAQHDDLSELIY